MGKFKKIILASLRRLSKLLKFRILIVQGKNVRPLAVKSDWGFWYCGDLFDPHDVSYGILQNGRVEYYESHLTVEILKILLRRNEKLCVYDIGAHTGYYTLMAASVSQKPFQVYAFEPVGEHLMILRENLRLNHFTENVTVFDFAIGEKNEEADMILAGSGSSLNKDFVGNPGASTTRIVVRRLDDIIENQSLTRPAFIKIDVEGQELSVLRGAKSVIRNSQPVIFMESYQSIQNFSGNYRNPHFAETMAFLENFGYQVWCLDQTKLILVNSKLKISGVRMFLALSPKDQSLLQLIQAVNVEQAS